MNDTVADTSVLIETRPVELESQQVVIRYVDVFDHFHPSVEYWAVIVAADDVVKLGSLA